MARTPFSRRLHKILAQQLANEASFDPSRRQFIQTSTLAAAALVAGPLRSFSPMLQSDTSSQRVAIVGAGAAGLAAAHDLRQRGISYKIFEGNDRVGGRILSDFTTFASQHQFCELGGELINSDHHSIRTFAKQLGVEVQEFPESDKDAGEPHDTFYFNGRYYSETELAASAAPLMRAILRDNAEIYGDDEQVPITWKCPYAANAAKFDQLSLSAYLDAIPELEEWFKAIVKIGYESDSGVPADSQSVLLMFSYFTGTKAEDFNLFGSSDETARIKGGNSRLIDAAFKAVGGAAVTEFNHRLVRIRDQGSKIELTFDVNGKSKVASFSQVVLAMPFLVLREVEGFSDSSLAIDPRVMRSVRELQYGKNSKMSLGYSERTWRNRANSATGTSISDLFTLNTWETSRWQDGSAGILTSYSPSKRAEELNPEHIPLVTADIEKIFPGTLAHFNGHAVVKNWPANPFARGSYSSPSMGQFTSIVGACDEPLLDGRLF
ncbi:MAG: flavin monoamine oxidase family protein, partial [Bdellovibrionota bacterium]